MPTPTYDLIASNVLTTATTSIQFTSLPSSYRDLVVVMTKFTDSGPQVHIQLNSDTSANYSYVLMRGNGSTTASGSGSGQTRWHFTDGLDGANTTTPGLLIIQLNDYSATDKHKTALARYNDPTRGTLAVAGRWASTSAVTSINIFTSSNMAVGTSVYLYGLVS